MKELRKNIFTNHLMVDIISFDILRICYTCIIFPNIKMIYLA